jgi:Uma2 family endonuclease
MDHPIRALETEEWEALVDRGEVPGPMSCNEYFSFESAEREELLLGWRVRQSNPIPKHQYTMANLVVLIGMHLIERSLGSIMAPTSDILLDEERRLVLQPDAAVILHDRMHVVGEKRLHAAPNLVVEALSPSTSRKDRVNKLAWYRQYGVDEYWIISDKKKQVEVYDLTAPPENPPAVFGEADAIISRVLPDLELRVEWLFGPLYQRAIQTVFSRSGTFSKNGASGSQNGHSSTSYASRNGNRRYDTDPT